MVADTAASKTLKTMQTEAMPPPSDECLQPAPGIGSKRIMMWRSGPMRPTRSSRQSTTSVRLPPLKQVVVADALAWYNAASFHEPKA
jgi:hypothetical protein